jgi:hypothetical protein
MAESLSAWAQYLIRIVPDKISILPSTDLAQAAATNGTRRNPPSNALPQPITAAAGRL